MKTAMILAAGRGERMRPLTDTLPKPLLEVAGKPLIVWQIERLAAAGFQRIVINIAYLGGLIKQALGNGSSWGVTILYSDERNGGALESAGGIVKALPLLADDRFIVVNADVWCAYPFIDNFDLEGRQAHLILVPNPEHNPKGDFGLANGLLDNAESRPYTFSGIGYYHRSLFDSLSEGKAALGPLLRAAADKGAVSAELYEGRWVDVGTPQRLEQLGRTLTAE
jgi:MurNAc alpha-1-phosphate uridylyltransferase